MQMFVAAVWKSFWCVIAAGFHWNTLTVRVSLWKLQQRQGNSLMVDLSCHHTRILTDTYTVQTHTHTTVHTDMPEQAVLKLSNQDKESLLHDNYPLLFPK